nr:hypothetical protein [Tanacetum cinerariifolium]
DLESSLDYFYKLFTPPFIILRLDSILHAWTVLKFQSIPSWFSKIKLFLITLNVELQVSYTLFDNNVPIPRLRSKDELCLIHEGVTVSFKFLDTYDNDNPHVRSDCTMIKWGTVSSDVEFLSLKPPVSNTVGCTNVVIMFTFNP